MISWFQNLLLFKWGNLYRYAEGLVELRQTLEATRGGGLYKLN